MSPLDVVNVSFGYASEPILDRINLTCRAGQVVGIVGASGIGKTTLLNLICGILPPSSGSIRIGGDDPEAAVRAHRIGYVFQHPNLLPWLSARNNVALPLQIQERPSSSGDIETHVQTAMRQCRIEDAASKFPDQLSGGMQTRVGLARAIVYRPTLLVLDEPFGGLDDAVREDLYSNLQSVIAETQAAVVLVTHNLIEAVVLSDDIHVLERSTNSSSATIVRSEHISLPRPRTLDVVSDERFVRAWRAVRHVKQC